MSELLKQRIGRLVAAYESEKVERERLQAELQEAVMRNETYRKQIKELERQIDNLRLAEAFRSAEGDAGTRKTIDRLIREIDRCIALLEG